MNALASKMRLVCLVLLLAGPLFYFSAGPLIHDHIFRARAERNALAGFAALVWKDGGPGQSRAIQSFAGFDLNPHQKRLQAWAVLDLPEDGNYSFRLECDDYARLLAGQTWVILQPATVSAHNAGDGSLTLAAGPALLYVELHNPGGGGWLKISLQEPGGAGWQPLDFARLRAPEPARDLAFWWALYALAPNIALLVFMAGLTGLGLLLLPLKSQPPHPDTRPDSFRAAVALLCLSGGALIFWRYLSADLAIDPAVTGRMGLAVLHGLWPVFFADQGFPGALDAYLAAPLYALWGPSVLIVNFFPAAFTLAGSVFLYLLLSKAFNWAGRLAGCAALFIPPAFVLYLAGEARTQYSLDYFLSAGLMYFSFGLAARPQWGRLRPLGWGLMAAAMVWMHNGAVSVIAACYVYLLFKNRGQSLRGLPWLALGGLLGLIPVMLYVLQWGLPPFMHGQTSLITRLSYFMFRGLPLLLGQELGRFWDAALLSPPLFIYAALLPLLVFALFYLFKSVRGAPRNLTLLPVLVILLGLPLVVLSGRNPWTAADGRYYIMVWLGLPFAWAALGQRLAVYKAGPWLLALALAGLAVPGYFSFMPFSQFPYWGKGGALLGLKQGFYLQAEEEYEAKARSIKELGLSHVLLRDDRLAFYLGGRPWAATYDDLYHLAYLEVEASLKPGIEKAPRSQTYDWLGLPHKQQGDILYDFADLPRAPLAVLEARLCDLEGRQLPPLLQDRNLSTGLEFSGPASQGFVLELAEPAVLNSLTLIPYHSGWLPDQVRLELAGPDGQFKLVNQAQGLGAAPVFISGPRPVMRQRFARLDTCFAPMAVKSIRLTGAKNRGPWSIREIRLYAPALPAPAGWEETARLLLAALDEQRPGFIYADPWPAAVIRTQRRLFTPALSKAEVLSRQNQDLSSYSFPHWFKPQAGQALVMEAQDAAEARLLLQEQNISHEVLPLGRLVWFKLNSGQTGDPLPGPRLRVSPDGVMQIELKEPQTFEWLQLGSEQVEGRGPWPRTLEVFLPEHKRSLKARLAGPLAFSGVSLLPAPFHQGLYRLPEPVKAASLEVTLSAGLQAEPPAGINWQVCLFAPR